MTCGIFARFREELWCPHCIYQIIDCCKNMQVQFNSRKNVLNDLNIYKIGIKPRITFKRADKRKSKSHLKVKQLTYRQYVNLLSALYSVNQRVVNDL
jgi:hypothetical protein